MLARSTMAPGVVEWTTTQHLPHSGGCRERCEGCDCAGRGCALLCLRPDRSGGDGGHRVAAGIAVTDHHILCGTGYGCRSVQCPRGHPSRPPPSTTATVAFGRSGGRPGQLLRDHHRDVRRLRIGGYFAGLSGRIPVPALVCSRIAAGDAVVRDATPGVEAQQLEARVRARRTITWSI